MQSEENMDKLQEKAFSFKKLIDFEYKIILGRKKNNFSFRECKLRDLRQKFVLNPFFEYLFYRI